MVRAGRAALLLGLASSHASGHGQDLEARAGIDLTVHQDQAPDSVFSHVSSGGSACYEGPTSRDALASLALRAAGILGRLYDNTVVIPGGCAERNFTHHLGADDCVPGVQLYFREPAEVNVFQGAKLAEVQAYMAEFNLTDVATANLMYSCTCHPDSVQRQQAGSRCTALSSQRGSIIDHNYVTQHDLACHEGPFVSATFNLANQKASAMVMMHQHDRILAARCVDLGFTFAQQIADMCWPDMTVYLRDSPTLALSSDAMAFFGLLGVIYHGGFEYWAPGRGLDVSGFATGMGCYCIRGAGGYNSSCDAPEARPLIVEWWSGTERPRLAAVWAWVSMALLVVGAHGQ